MRHLCVGAPGRVTFQDLRLTADKVSCIRGGRLVLDRLSFTCDAATPLVVRGPNGAGKSTLLRLIAGLATLSHGKLGLTGRQIVDEGGVNLDQVHYVGHADGVKSVLSVRENLSFWSALLGADGSFSALERALDAFGLGNVADLPAQFLSAGQRRRVSLARLVVSKRPLWLLDEPTAALDANALEKLNSLMAAHCESGGLLVVATHDALKLAGARSLDLSSSQFGVAS